MRIFAIRHGLTEHNKQGKFNGRDIDEPLAPEGMEQAGLLQDVLPKGIQKMYVSTMLRTRQTAEIINKDLSVPLEFSSDIEEVDVGTLSGKSFEEMNSEVGRDILNEYKAQQYSFSPWGGENAADVHARVKRLMEKIKSQDSDKTILVVAHGGIIRVLYFLYKNEIIDAAGNLSVHEFEI